MAAPPSSATDLVPAGPVVDASPGADAAVTAKSSTGGSPAAFAAQVLGQGGQRNGLRGGPPVLDTARATYLGAEYSGEKERRPVAGASKTTDV